MTQVLFLLHSGKWLEILICVWHVNEHQQHNVYVVVIFFLRVNFILSLSSGMVMYVNEFKQSKNKIYLKKKMKCNIYVHNIFTSRSKDSLNDKTKSLLNSSKENFDQTWLTN